LGIEEYLMERKLGFEVTFPFWVAYTANLQIIRWSPLQLAVSALFPIAGLFLAYLWITHHHALQIADVLLFFGCLFFTPLIMVLTLFLARRKNPLSQGPFAYVFDADGIHASGPTFSVSLKWAAIQKVRESNSFLFFFVAPGRAHSMPLDQLQSAGILHGVRELALQNVSDTRFRGAQQRAAGDARNART
jgi:hypothetical protein